MVTNLLTTELQSELDAVELAWDGLFDSADGASPMRWDGLAEWFAQSGAAWVLLGRHEIAVRVEEIVSGRTVLEGITVPGRGPLAQHELDELAERATERLGRGAVNVFVCLTDRYDAHRLSSALPAGTAVHTLDVLKHLVGDQIPVRAWRKKLRHIYPIEIPEISIQKNLDVLLLDLPARSLAQLPIGFAYVYKAVKQTSLNVQAIDVDLIAYHRYHSRRCLNDRARIESHGMVHPEDPWQAENYIVWTDQNFVDYFSDFLNEVADKIIAARPRAIGFSLHQTSHVSVKRVVERVRKALPDICVVVGGMSCYQHIVAQRIFPDADYVIVGEADTVVGPLMEAVARGERPIDLPGIVSPRDTPGRGFTGAPLPHNLDVIGGPDYGFGNLDLYVNWNGYRLMPLVGSRGCGWSRCTFCAERFNWRARTPELVVEEIESYTKRGFKDFVFNESDFNSNLSFVVRLCKEIVRRGIKANFSAQLRVGKDCDYEYYKTMKDAGFSCLRFGVDGLSENTLRLQRKGYTKDMVISNLKHCHELGIYTEINVVIGVPGETEADVDESADFLIEMKPYIGRVAFINPLMLFVGSVYYFEPERHQIHFVGDKDELYKQYFVALPDSSWYSENPYIDHTVRSQRFFHIVEKIRAAGVPLGAFANFTAEFRKALGDDSLNVRQANSAAMEASGEPVVAHERTEFQNTFYGSWSSALLGGTPWERGRDGGAPQLRVVNVDGQFYLAGKTVVLKSKVTRTYATPRLLRTYKGYNLVGYQAEVLGAPVVLGHLDLTRTRDRDNPHIIHGFSEDDVTRVIDFIDGARTLRERPRPVAVLATAVHEKALATDAAPLIPVASLRKVKMGKGVLLRAGK